MNMTENPNYLPSDKYYEREYYLQSLKITNLFSTC